MMNTSKLRTAGLIGLALLTGACAQLKNKPSAKVSTEHLMISGGDCTPPPAWDLSGKDDVRGMISAQIVTNYPRNGAVNVSAKAVVTAEVAKVNPRSLIGESDRSRQALAKMKTKDFGPSLAMYLSQRPVTVEGYHKLTSAQGRLIRLQQDQSVMKSAVDSKPIRVTLLKGSHGEYVSAAALENMAGTVQSATGEAPAEGQAQITASGARSVRSFIVAGSSDTDMSQAISVPASPEPAGGSVPSPDVVSGTDIELPVAPDPDVPSGVTPFLVAYFQDRATRTHKAVCVSDKTTDTIKIPTSWKDAKDKEQNIIEGMQELAVFRGYLTTTAMDDDAKGNLYVETRAGYLTYLEIKPKPKESK
ncbi:MAG: hypothetical protein V1798_10570 [Pseudomonadota bacterium]